MAFLGEIQSGVKLQDAKSRDTFIGPLPQSAPRSDISSQYGSPVSQALLSCTSTGECNKYGKDDIYEELTRRGLKPVARPTKPDEFNQNARKPELVDILLNHNKREIARLNLIEKRTKSGLRYTRGSFPSEATNPAMYEPNTGLLQTKYLTQDHHGLTAYDYKGDKYTVEYRPKLNGFGGDAEWVKSKSGMMGPGGRNVDITGKFPVIDKRGLPKVTQLNYIKHAGAVHKGKNNKWYILICKNRKNKKSLSIHPSNCKPNKNGTFTMQWVLFDKDYTLDPMPEQQEDRKFFLPDGSVVTGKQLNKLSLEEIWRMMMLLELMEQGPAYAKKMRALGLGPDGTTSGPAIPGVEQPKRKRSLLDPTDRAKDEAKFAKAGLDTCEYPRPPFRCYSDSYIPGACVPHEEICFNSEYQSHWDGASRYGQNPEMQWAEEKRAELARAGALASEESYNAWKAQQALASGRPRIYDPNPTAKKGITYADRAAYDAAVRAGTAI